MNRRKKKEKRRKKEMPRRKRTKREQMGFKQAMEYVLDTLCYAYYCKNNNLVSDQVFDELERLYIDIFDEESAPMRAMESEIVYSKGVKVVYDYIKEKRRKE